MKIRMIVRLLDGERNLLGWNEVEAETRGDRCIWPVGERAFVAVETAGTVRSYNVHWVDANVNVDIDVPPMIMEVGQIWALRFDEPLMQLGSSTKPLPAVTVRRSVVVEPPVGSMGMRGH